MVQANPFKDRLLVWAVPGRDDSAEPVEAPYWVDQAASAMREAGARVDVVPVETRAMSVPMVGALATAEVVLATSMAVGQVLVESGFERHRLWTFLQGAPGRPFAITESNEDDIRAAVSSSRKVIVFDEDARSTVEGAVWDSAMNVLVFPIAGRGPLPEFRAAAGGPPALVIQLELTGPLGLAAIRRHADAIRPRRDPQPVFLVGGPDLQSTLRTHPVHREFAAIPGARAVLPDDLSLAEALHGVRPLGFVPGEDSGKGHRVEAIRTWFEARGIELFAEHGVLPALPRYASTPRWDAGTLTADLDRADRGAGGRQTADDVPPPAAPDTGSASGFAGAVAELFAPYLPDYAAVPRRPGKLKVLLVGADFKFAGDMVEALSMREDIDLRVDRWEFNGKPQPEASRPLLDWAEVVLCEFASANAVWYSHNVLPNQRLILHLHGYELRQPPIHDIEIGAVETVVFASDFYRQKALDITGWPRERTSVIANTVQSSDLARPKLRDARFHLGMAGFIPELKRPDRALDLLEELLAHDDRYTLHLRGHLPWNYPYVWKNLVRRESYLAFFERLQRNPGLRQAVVFDSFGPDMGNWFRGIGWMLSTSTRETFHLAPAEGMASGAVPVVWRREGSDEIFPERWNVDDAAQAAELILNANEDPARYDFHGFEAASFARRYDARTVVHDWLNRVLGPTEASGRSGPAAQLVEVDPSTGLTGTWAEAETLVAADQHVRAQALIDPTVDHPWQQTSRQRRLAGEVFGVPALRQRVHHLLSRRVHPPLRPGGVSALVVYGPGLSARDAVSALAVGPLSTIHLPEAWDQANSVLDAWVDRISRRALQDGAGSVHAVGDELTAVAVEVAAQRLGLQSTWDVTESSSAADRIAAAAADPYRASDRGILSLMAARHAGVVHGAQTRGLDVRSPIEDRIERPLLMRRPVVGLIGGNLDLTPLARPLRGVKLDRQSSLLRIREGLDALLISGRAARHAEWNTIVSGSDTVLDQAITEARRYNVPIGLLDDDSADLEPVLRYARRVDVVLAPGAEDVDRLHDRRIVPTQVASALPKAQPDGVGPASSLLNRDEALELILRMLRINQQLPS